MDKNDTVTDLRRQLLEAFSKLEALLLALLSPLKIASSEPSDKTFVFHAE